MRPMLRPVLTGISILLFLPALYFFRVMLARADSSEETFIRNYSIVTGLLLFTLSVGLGVCAVFLDVPPDPAKKFNGRRLGCLAVAVLIVGFVTAGALIRILSTDH